MRPAVFFDRDNTLIVGSDYLGDPAGVELMPGAVGCVAAVRRAGFATVVVSNQSGVARGKFGEDDVLRVDERVAAALLAGDPEARLDLQLFCPHHPKITGACRCRKPGTGMLNEAAATLGLALSQSWLIGDAPRDIEAGAAAGCRTILFTPPGLPRSPAADAEPAVVPTHSVTSLDEVAAIITADAVT